MSHRIPKPSFSSVAAGNRNNVEASTSTTPKIIVKFVHRDTRDRFYAARKNLRDKTTANLDLLMPSENKIYISENLTATNTELFKDCLKVKKDLNYRFTWTHYGRIFLHWKCRYYGVKSINFGSITSVYRRVDKCQRVVSHYK